MGGIALALAGASIASSLIGGKSASSAAKSQAKSADKAAQLQYQLGQDSLGFQKQVYADQKAAQAPYQQAGGDALGYLKNRTSPWFGDFQADPGYQFRLQQGQNALDKVASARGMSMSGAALKSANDYAQGQAAQEYGNWWNRSLEQDNTTWNRLAGLAGIGQTATNQVNAAGSNAAGNVAGINSGVASNMGNAYMAAGNARASGYQGVGNAWQNALSGLAGVAGMAQSGVLGSNPWGFGGNSAVPAAAGSNWWGGVGSVY